jgi:hypothetical protein
VRHVPGAVEDDRHCPLDAIDRQAVGIDAQQLRRHRLVAAARRAGHVHRVVKHQRQCLRRRQHHAKAERGIEHLANVLAIVIPAVRLVIHRQYLIEALRVEASTPQRSQRHVCPRGGSKEGRHAAIVDRHRPQANEKRREYLTDKAARVTSAIDHRFGGPRCDARPKLLPRHLTSASAGTAIL